MKNKLELQDLKSKIERILYHQISKKTTMCLILLKNGFEIVGSSACVCEENFDKEIGEVNAYEDAINKLWCLEGYLLQNELSKSNKEEKSRKNSKEDSQKEESQEEDEDEDNR